MPIPEAVHTMGSMRKGRKAARHVGVILIQAIIPASITKEIAKSTSPDNTGVMGMMSLGKYTLVRRLVFPTRLLLELVMAVEKYVQGIRAVKAKRG